MSGQICSGFILLTHWGPSEKIDLMKSNFSGPMTQIYISDLGHHWFRWWLSPGPWFNTKMSSYQYRKSHCGDKTISRPSYLHNGIFYTGKTASLYWIGPWLTPLLGPMMNWSKEETSVKFDNTNILLTKEINIICNSSAILFQPYPVKSYFYWDRTVAWCQQWHLIWKPLLRSSSVCEVSRKESLLTDKPEWPLSWRGFSGQKKFLWWRKQPFINTHFTVQPCHLLKSLHQPVLMQNNNDNILNQIPQKHLHDLQYLSHTHL